jgi:drug/metabolite transporter (DMT)-like permease
MSMHTSIAARLIALGAIWGASFLLQRVAVPALGAGAVAFGRIALAAVAMLVLLAALGRSLNWRARWKDYALIGAINSAIPFWLFAYAAPSLPSGYLSVLNGTVPLFTVLVAAFLGTRPTAPKLLGVLLGIVGVALIVGFGVVAITANTLLAFGAGLLAALLYAIATNVIRQRFSGADPLVVATGSLNASAPLLLPLALSNLGAMQLSLPALICLVALGLVCTALAYVFYFGLLRDAGPDRAVTVTLLVPVFAHVFGALFLREPLTVSGVVGCALVLCAIALVFGKLQWPTRAAAKAATSP